MNRVFVAQSAGSLGASSAEQFYVSVSRARDSVTVYTDDKARLAETIQSSGARMTAHELLRLPTPAKVIDPFESMLQENVTAPPSEALEPNLPRKKKHATEYNQAEASPRKNPQVNPSIFVKPGEPTQGISL